MASAFGSLYDEIEKQRVAAGGAPIPAPPPKLNDVGGRGPGGLVKPLGTDGGLSDPAVQKFYTDNGLVPDQVTGMGGALNAGTTHPAPLAAGASNASQAALMGDRNRLQIELERIRGLQNSNISTTQSDQARAQQLGLVGILQQQAMGQGPSAATSMLQDANERSFGQAISLAKSGNGVNPAAAFDTAQRMAADASQGNARSAAGIRAGEQISAQQGLAGIIAGMRGQDQSLAESQFGAGLQQNAMKESLIQQYMQAGMSMDEARFRAEVQQNQFNADLRYRQQAAADNVGVAGSAQTMQLLGAGAQFGGGLINSFVGQGIGK